METYNKLQDCYLARLIMRWNVLEVINVGVFICKLYINEHPNFVSMIICVQKTRVCDVRVNRYLSSPGHKLQAWCS